MVLSKFYTTETAVVLYVSTEEKCGLCGDAVPACLLRALRPRETASVN